MSILKISNLFNKIVQADNDLAFYHFGFLDELNTSPENNFNIDGQNGRLYPSLDFLPPEFIEYSSDDAEAETYKIDLYFSDLYGYDNCGDINNRSKLEVWADLQKIVKKFIFTLNPTACGAIGGGISSPVRLELDAGFNDRILFIKVSFNFVIIGECFDDTDLALDVSEHCDLENYKCCN